MNGMAVQSTHAIMSREHYINGARLLIPLAMDSNFTYLIVRIYIYIYINVCVYVIKCTFKCSYRLLQRKESFILAHILKPKNKHIKTQIHHVCLI